MAQFVEVLTGESDFIPNSDVMTFPFECDNFQKFSFKSIHEHNNILVTVPTSSGKTTVAEYAIVYNVKVLKKRVVYTSPIKSLSNEKYNDFKKRFEQYGITIGLLTGDNKIDVNSDCLIVTAEILRNSLYKLKDTDSNPNNEINDEFVNSIGCVIMDEVHFMNDPDRGRVWEETIILLNNDIQLVMLSATISNAIKFASWVGQCKQKKISLIQADKRIIPLEHNIFVSNKLYPIITKESTYISESFNNAKKAYVLRQANRRSKGLDMEALHQLVDYLKTHNLFQTICFSFSKENCEKYAREVSEKLVDHRERSQIEMIFNQKMAKYMATYEFVRQYSDLKELLPKGVAYHHSGLLPIFKEIIEILFKEGFIKMLFATETFAVGVNMPARSVVFTETSKFTKLGKRSLSTAEYKQMSGRAGRRGLDTSGTVIILPLYDLLDESDFRTIAFGRIPSIDSQFKWDYQFYLKILQSNVTSIENFFEKSLINVDNKSQLSAELKQEEVLKTHIQDLESNTQSFDSDIMEQVNKVINLDKKYLNSNKIGLKMSRQQQKEYDSLKLQITKNQNTLSLYKLMQQIVELKTELNKVQNTIIAYNNFVGQSIEDISCILEEWGYLENGKVTLKGTVASQINECNAIILSELIIGNYFNDLTPQEIIALISIFCEPIKNSQIDDTEYQYEGTENLRNRLDDLNALIDESIQSEYDLAKFTSEWSITTSYIDIAYKWANGCEMVYILRLLDECGEYEGNFVRNMLKIYNIANNIKYICKTIGKHELLPMLEQVDALILRNIVTVNSLYLGI